MLRTAVSLPLISYVFRHEIMCVSSLILAEHFDIQRK